MGDNDHLDASLHEMPRRRGTVEVNQRAMILVALWKLLRGKRQLCRAASRRRADLVRLRARVALVAIPVHDDLRGDDRVEHGRERKAPEQDAVIRLGECRKHARDRAHELCKHDEHAQLAGRLVAVQLEDLRHLGRERDGDREALQELEQVRGHGHL